MFTGHSIGNMATKESSCTFPEFAGFILYTRINKLTQYATSTRVNLNVPFLNVQTFATTKKNNN